MGLTGEGEVALLRTLVGKEAVVLPGVTVTEVGEGRDLLAVDRLLGTLGYDARELVTMSRYGIPDGSGGHSSILMAPLLMRREARRPSIPGLVLHEIPIARAAEWLRERRGQGARVDPKVWVGLLLVERQFPSWARERIRASLKDLRRRHFPGRAISGGRRDSPGPRESGPRESARGA
ncbi:MAG TPA: hypothetical protein VGK26_06160 [Thermoanaerobaculia bacterium]